MNGERHGETAPNRQYTDEFKLEALQLPESVGIDGAAQRLGSGKEVVSASAELSPQGLGGRTGSREQPAAARVGECQSLIWNS